MQACILLGRTGRGATAEQAAGAASKGAGLLCTLRCDAGVQDEAAAACTYSMVTTSLGTVLSSIAACRVQALIL